MDNKADFPAVIFQRDRMSTRFRICNCNHSMPLDAAAGAKLGEALGTEPLPVASGLCRRELGRYEKDVQGPDRTVVACTQEQARFSELAQQQKTGVPLQFVNIRETANWGKEAGHGLAKTAALLAQAALPDPDPVPSVHYTSRGNTLIIGRPEQALPWAERLSSQLAINVLLTSSAGAYAVQPEPGFQVFSGDKVEVSGWLGAFEVTWQQSNPIDLALCVGCNACVDACPEHAIDALYQVDTDRCDRHGNCIKACGAIGAIDFSRSKQLRLGRFDLILDLSDTPLIALHQPPQGYFAPGAAQSDQFRAVLQLTQMVGDFEKPKYFSYKQKLCAHSRNRKAGCSACIDVCSAKAIGSNDNHIRVNPNLCVGCGACATVCPSGALGYAYPAASYTGRRLKAALTAYAKAGGVQAAFLLHSEKRGRATIRALGQLARKSKQHRGLPARLIPIEVHHTASVGIDVWLTALAYGAAGIAVLTTDEEAPQYIEALNAQMAIAQTILSELGYAGTHFQMIRATTPEQLDAALRNASNGEAPQQMASFHVAADKRNTLDFALDHLYRHAPRKPDRIALPAGAPFGAIKVDTAACTVCMSCVGSCPESALMAGQNVPQLRFIEKNCVQCGLCEKTCPENAITLMPQISFADSAKQPVVLHESKPFCCIRCNKPIGTMQMVENMLSKLSLHAAFAGNLDRIKMCGDCRVVDMMQGQSEKKIVELKR
jgi:ferredoxin